MKILGMSSRKIELPDFSLWKDKSIKVAGLTFAPEDFCINKKTTMLCLKRFFSYPEAMECEEKILIPNGWRFPTEKEWKKVVDEFEGDTDDLCRHIGIRCYGYVPSYSMDEYYEPANYAFEFCHESLRGYYWSRDMSFRNYAYYLQLGRRADVGYTTIWDGLLLRCVSLK